MSAASPACSPRHTWARRPTSATTAMAASSSCRCHGHSGYRSIIVSDASGDWSKAAARLLGQRRALEAMHLLEQVLAREPRNVDALLMSAQAEQQRSRLAGMLDRTSKALEFAPAR